MGDLADLAGSGEFKLAPLRAIEKGDLIRLCEDGGPPMPTRTIANLRYAHHEVARMIVEGKRNEEIALITGLSPGTISGYKSNPAFRELLAYYREQKERVFVDVMERMRVVGLSTLDELMHRLDTEPEGWSRRELMELAKLTMGDLPQGQARRGGTEQGLGQGRPLIEVKFVTSSEAKPLVEVTPVMVEAKDG